MENIIYFHIYLTLWKRWILRHFHSTQQVNAPDCSKILKHQTENSIEVDAQIYLAEPDVAETIMDSTSGKTNPQWTETSSTRSEIWCKTQSRQRLFTEFEAAEGGP